MQFTENKETWYSFLTVLILGIVYIAFSNGFYFIDEPMHYFYNRHFFEGPAIWAAGAWHRLGRMLLFSVPAYFGHGAVMVTGFAIYMLTLLIVYKIVKQISSLNPYPVILIAGLQPVFFDISYTCMAEGPATFLVALSSFLYLKKRFSLSMIAASLVFLFRTEMSLYAGLLALLFIYEKRYKEIPLAAVGPIFWWAYAYIFSGNPMHLYNELEYFSRFPKYKEGVEIYYYLVFAPVIFGFVTLFLFAFGIKLFKKIEHRNFYYLVITTIITTFILNTLYALKYIHISGSVGDLRYLTPLTPFVAVIAFFGYYQFKDYLVQKRRNVKYYYLIIPVLMLLNLIIQVRPHTLTASEQVVKKNTLRVKELLQPGEKIYSNSAISFFVLNTPHENKGIIERYNIAKLIKAEKGYFLWDTFSCDNVLNRKRFTAEDIKRIPGITVLDSQKVNKEEQHYLFKKN